MDLSAHIQDVLQQVHRSGVTLDEEGVTREVAPTGMTEGQGQAIAQIIESEGARRTIETGFAFGVSALYMILGTLRAGVQSRQGAPTHYAFDPLEQSLWANAGLELVKKARATHLLRFQERGAQFAMPQLIEQGMQFDLGLVDGDHRFESAFIDIYHMQHLVRPGGLILVDDLWMPAVRGAVHYFVKNGLLTLDKTTAPHINGTTALLRTPERAVPRAWDHFVPFGFGGV